MKESMAKRLLTGNQTSRLKTQLSGDWPSVKLVLSILMIGGLTANVISGDYGGGKSVYPKQPIGISPKEPKAVIGCPDTSGYVDVGYHSAGVYKGYRLAEDTVTVEVGYTFDDILPLPVTLSVVHWDGHGSGGLFGMFYGGLDMTELGVSSQVASLSGFDFSLSYVHRFFGRDYGAMAQAGSSGEFGLNITKDLGVAVAHLDVFYNLNNPSAWNLAPVDNDSGSWYWDLGLDKTITLTDKMDLVLSGGVGYADNYWGRGLLNAQTPRSSGWNHYYLRASFPIKLNCRATLTPYVAYNGAPDGWLMDGNRGGGTKIKPGTPYVPETITIINPPDNFYITPATPATPASQDQSDFLYYGINLRVEF